eukprot:6353773-Karenia_brevis.AAC.1
MKALEHPEWIGKTDCSPWNVLQHDPHIKFTSVDHGLEELNDLAIGEARGMLKNTFTAHIGV